MNIAVCTISQKCRACVGITLGGAGRDILKAKPLGAVQNQAGFVLVDITGRDAALATHGDIGRKALTAGSRATVQHT